jgi:hypothetical protein
MRKLLIPAIIVCCLIAFPITQAGATGLGFYVERAGGSGDWEREPDEDTAEDYDSDEDATAFGFVLDTNVARDRIFNDRLQIGYEKWEPKLKLKGSGGEGRKLELKGFAMTHDFGFGVLRTRHVRLWLGPELKLGYYTGSPEDYDRYDMWVFKYGVGPVIGANFNIGEVVTLAVKAGFLLQGHVGIGEEDYTYEEDTITGSSTQFYVNFALIFRIGDSF